jgi:hypothetical protein
MIASATGSTTWPIPARLEVRFAACWEVIEDTRNYLVRALAHAVRSPARLQQIGIAAHELMENAFRYSPATDVTLHILIEEGTIRITAENDATPERIAELCDEIEALCAAQDALAHYQRKMEEAVSTPRAEGSGLGLARVRWEAKMSVDFRVDGSRVAVSARGIVD